MKNNANSTPLQNGAIPPQALDIEQAVLGAMIADRQGVEEAVELLSSDVFYKDQHQHIYEAIFQLFLEGQPSDLLTVSNKLKKNGKLEAAGGDLYLVQLTQKVASSAHIEFHCRILQQKHVQRELIRVSSQMTADSYSEDADALDLLDNAYTVLGGVTELISIGRIQNFSNSVDEYVNRKTTSALGIPSSIDILNRNMRGYQDSDLIILAARPGMGKTAFALNEILECGLRGIPVAFFSLEMSTKQIIGRLLSIMSGIDSTRISSHDLSPSETQYVKRCADLLRSLPIYIDDTPAISTIEFKIKLSRMVRKSGIQKCFVDYLQLMKVKGKSFNRENEVSEISASLKAAAKSLNIPITALSQLSRKVEERGSSKRPLLSDLRDSGSIEQDADIVLFLYRPEYYKIETWDDQEGAPTVDTAEIDIAKFRNGQTGGARIGCNLRYMRFMDIELLGKDLTYKYFRDGAKEVAPTLLASQDESDVPF